MPAKSASKKRNWKDNKNQAKKTKSLRLGIVVLGFVITVIILGNIFNLIKILISPWGLSTNSAQSGFWDGKFNANILIQSDTSYLLNFNPQKEQVTVIKIPDEVYLDVGGGYGEWVLSSIYALGESSKKGSGYRLVKSAVASLLGVPIDGYIRFEGKNPRSFEDIMGIIRQNPISGLGLLSEIKSDLTTFTLMRLKMGIWKVRFDKVSFLDLAKEDVFDPLKLADGSSVLVADSIKLDSITDFVDPKIREENLSVAFFNATDYPLLAQRAKRMITNLGGNVIIVANSSEKIKNTYILGEDSATLKRMHQIFNFCQNQPKCDNIPQKSNQLASRAQINIFLGEDFVNFR